MLMYLSLFGLVCHSVTLSNIAHCDVRVGRSLTTLSDTNVCICVGISCLCSLSSEAQNLISDMCGYCWHYLTGHILAVLQQYQVYVYFLYYVIYSEMSYGLLSPLCLYKLDWNVSNV